MEPNNNSSDINPQPNPDPTQPDSSRLNKPLAESSYLATQTHDSNLKSSQGPLNTGATTSNLDNNGIYSGYTTAGLTSNLGSSNLGYKADSQGVGQPSSYLTSTFQTSIPSYQFGTRTEGYTQLYGTTGTNLGASGYNLGSSQYSSKDSSSPALNTLNTNTLGSATLTSAQNPVTNPMTSYTSDIRGYGTTTTTTTAGAYGDYKPYTSSYTSTGNTTTNLGVPNTTTSTTNFEPTNPFSTSTDGASAYEYLRKKYGLGSEGGLGAGSVTTNQATTTTTAAAYTPTATYSTPVADLKTSGTTPAPLTTTSNVGPTTIRGSQTLVEGDTSLKRSGYTSLYPDRPTNVNARYAAEEVKADPQEATKNLYGSNVPSYNDFLSKYTSTAYDQTKPLVRSNIDNIGSEPTSHTPTEKKLRATQGSYGNQYQSTVAGASYLNTLRTPTDSVRRRDHFASAKFSGMASPPLRQDALEGNAGRKQINDILINEPVISKKTLYTIDNTNSNLLRASNQTANDLSRLGPKTPDRPTQQRSESTSPFDDLRYALKSENVQISKIVIETVENYTGEPDIYHSPQSIRESRDNNNRLDIVMEQLIPGTEGTQVITKSPNRGSVPRRTEDYESSFRDPSIYNRDSVTRTTMNIPSSVPVAATSSVSTLNERLKNLEEFVNKEKRESPQRVSARGSPDTKKNPAAELLAHLPAPVSKLISREEPRSEEKKPRSQYEEYKSSDRGEQYGDVTTHLPQSEPYLRQGVKKVETEKEIKQKEKEREKQLKKEKEEKEKQLKKEKEEKEKQLKKEEKAREKELKKNKVKEPISNMLVRAFVVFLVVLLSVLLWLELATDFLLKIDTMEI